MRLRSREEITFRLKQEFSNVGLWLRPPAPSLRASAPLPGLPDPGPIVEALRGTAFRDEVVGLADEVLAGKYPLLGTVFDLGANPDWRRDFISGRSSDEKYFRRVPYLDASRVGDHKVIWELNRHQWMVVLAQAYRFTGNREYVGVIERHLATWFDQNPYMRGINWCSALEIAFRALSWMWVVHLVGDDLSAGAREQLLTGLYQHGVYLEHNLSFYFSPNTHLLGEAVALHAIGTLFPEWPRARWWAEHGGRVTEQQLDAQIEEDGSHFEQSTYYQVYAMDFFMLYWILARLKPPLKARRMGTYLDVLLGPDRAIPLIGDDDGGRLFHPYGDGRKFGRATLATFALQLGRSDWKFDTEDLWPQAAWWLGVDVLRAAPQPGGAPARANFANTGMVVLASGDIQVLFDAGPFGRGSGGHSHSDTLSVVVRRGREEILVDSGTFTYVGDPVARDEFRGTAAHNTVRVDGRDQATPATPFRWDDKPEVRLIGVDFAATEAVCKTRTYEHRRSVALEGNRLIVRDAVTGGEVIEQFWHPGEAVKQTDANTFRIGESTMLVLPAEGKAELLTGWRSIVYGQRSEAPLIRYVPVGREFTTELIFD